MARTDEIYVDDPPPGMPSVLRDQRARLAGILTPPTTRPREEDPPNNPLLDASRQLPEFLGRALSGAGDVAVDAARGLLESDVGKDAIFAFQNPLDIPAGLYGIGLQKAVSFIPGAGRGRELQAVTEAVRQETEQLPAYLRPFVTPILYAAAAGEAKRIAHRQADLPAIEVGRIGDTPIRFDPLDIAEIAMPFSGVLGGVAKAKRTLDVAKQFKAPAEAIEESARIAQAAARSEDVAAGLSRTAERFGHEAYAARGVPISPRVVPSAARTATDVGDVVPMGNLIGATARGARVLDVVQSEAAAGAKVAKVAEAAEAVTAAPDVAKTTELIKVADIIETFAARQRRAAEELAEDAMILTREQTERMEKNIKAGALTGKPAIARTQDEVFREIGANLDKLEVDDSVKQLILANAARNYDDISRLSFTDQRRGVQTIAEQWEKARHIIPDLSLEDVLRIKPGKAMNAETLLATQASLIGKAEDVIQTAGRLAANANDADKARLIVEMTELSALHRVLAGGRAEAGRSLRALRETVKPGESTHSMWEEAAKFIGGREKGEQVVRGLVEIWTDPSFAGKELARDEAVFKYLRGLESPGALNFILEVRRNALLSGPPTLVVNALGNTSLLVAERSATRFAQAGWEAVLAAMGRRPNGREVFFSEVFPGIQGMTAGFGRGLQNARMIAQAKMTPDQISKFLERGDLPRGEATEALLRQVRVPQPIAGTVSAVVNAPTRALAATDAVFYEMARSGELYAQAARQAAKDMAKAKKEGIRGASFDDRIAQLIQKPTAQMLRAAKEHAELVTLKGEPSTIAKSVLRLRADKNPLIKTAANILMPFVQAPDSLIRLGGSYSPLGFIDAAIGSGRAGGAARSAALARASVASVGMYAFFLSKLQSGEIDVTGTVPANPDERRQFYSEGKVPYAVKIGDQWIQYSRLEPFSTPIKWMAAARDVYERNGRTLSPEVAFQMVGVGARAIFDASYLTGLSDFASLLDRPDEDLVSAFLARTGAGFIPFSSMLRTTAYANDPFYRDPDTTLERIEAQLPWTYQKVRPVLEVTGEPARRPESKRGVIGMVNPIIVSPERQNEIIATLNSLTMPETIGPGGEKIPGRPLVLGFPTEDIRDIGLTKTEGFRLKEVAQALAMRELEKTFASDEFRSSAAWRQRALAEAVIDKTRRTARGLVADEIVGQAKTPAEVARGAMMKIATIVGDGTRTRIGNTAEYVALLSAQGKLSPEVKAQLDLTRREIDSLQGKPDPTVDEMMRLVPAMRKYLAEPPYGSRTRPYGTAEEWARLKDLHRKAREYAETTKKPAGIAEWYWYSQKDREGANLIRKYQLVGPNPERAKIMKANPGLDRLLD